MKNLLDALEVHLETRGAKALASLKSHLKPVRGVLGDLRAIDVTTARIETYMAEQLAATKARATVNREIGALKQAFRLAFKQERLSRVPYLPLLREDNTRRGFLAPDELEAVVKHLADSLQDFTRFAFLSAWRKGEIATLRWDAVDRTAREIRLATSKNGRPRSLPLSGALWALIERRWAAREYQRPTGGTALSPYVFHRQGAPVGDFRKAWASACKTAKLSGRLFHDLRRSAIRNMVRAGVSERVAMEISGHRTRSTFDRYNIVNEDDKRDALQRTEVYVTAAPKERVVIPLRAEGQGGMISRPLAAQRRESARHDGTSRRPLGSRTIGLRAKHVAECRVFSYRLSTGKARLDAEATQNGRRT